MPLRIQALMVFEQVGRDVEPRTLVATRTRRHFRGSPSSGGTLNLGAAAANLGVAAAGVEHDVRVSAGSLGWDVRRTRWPPRSSSAVEPLPPAGWPDGKAPTGAARHHLTAARCRS